MRAFRIMAILWVAAIAYGAHTLMTYKGVSGPAGLPSKWPENKLIALPSDRPLLLMVAHPRCPCTRASLGELERLMAKAQEPFEAVIVFHEPSGTSVNWSDHSIVQQAKAIVEARVVIDETGALARSLKTETSGHTLVYSPSGKLLFSGGITGSRGHMGDNPAADAALAAVEQQAENARGPKTAKVFGCEVFN